MVTNTNQKERLFDLTATVTGLVRDGKRDAKEVADILQEIKENCNFMAKFFPVDKSPSAQLKDWERLYKKMFGLKKDFSNLKIPAHKDGFDRLIIVAQGMTSNKIYNKIKELMPAWKYSDNLDEITSVRKATNDYAIWIRDRVEADEELKNKSANDLEKEGVIGITLEERLLYELKYFQETGKHLDVQNVTLCSGSRHPDGSVPRAHWHEHGGEVSVGWYNASFADDDLRCRVAVS